jgi:hypothetical protein
MWTAPHARKAGESIAGAQLCGNRTVTLRSSPRIRQTRRRGGMELANPSAQASDGFDCATFMERKCEA